MPHVTVKLIYTPKPDDDVAFVEFEGDPKGLAVHFGHGRVWIEPEDLSSNPSLTPAEAIALARALVLVAGCADPYWRGHHWEAREQNGRLLATTPLGGWYFNQDDCLKAIWKMFGYGVRVVLDYGSGGDKSPLLRFADDIHALAETIPVPTDDNIGANYCPDSSLLNYAAAHLAAADTPEAEQ